MAAGYVPRFEVRPSLINVGGDGWGVFDTLAGMFVGGWFAKHIRIAAEQTCVIHENGWLVEQVASIGGIAAWLVDELGYRCLVTTEKPPPRVLQVGVEAVWVRREGDDCEADRERVVKAVASAGGWASE